MTLNKMTLETITEVMLLENHDPKTAIRMTFDHLLDFKKGKYVNFKTPEDSNLKSGRYLVSGRELDEMIIVDDNSSVLKRSYTLNYAIDQD